MVKLKRIRRWVVILSNMGKRNKDKRADRYAFDDDERSTTSAPAVETERHRHVDHGATGQRPSVRTSYVNVPRVHAKRRRASSCPPPPPSAPYDDTETPLDYYVDGVDHAYVLDIMRSMEADTVGVDKIRRRTAAVCLVLLICICHD